MNCLNHRSYNHWFNRDMPSSRLQASKTHLDFHERGLHGVSGEFGTCEWLIGVETDTRPTTLTGAKQVIDLLDSHTFLQHLILGNNQLRDEGTAALFDYLSSSRGRRLNVIEISLNSCRIGNLGLRAICQYLDGNETLQMLFLQNVRLSASRQ